MPRAVRSFYALLLLSLTVCGCVRGPVFVPAGQRKPIDRAIVDYPGECVLEVVAHGLTGPIDCDFDNQGNLIIAESGAGGYEPHIIGCRPDGSTFSIYPPFRPIRVPFDLATIGYTIYGPIGGIAVDGRKVFVSHRDKGGNGVVTAFNYDGSHQTVVASIPCQGDNGMSDVALNNTTGRLWFGVGSATNSGVVGLDNWDWVKKYPNFCDRSHVDLKLNGFQFKSKHPDAGLFGAPEIAVTAPYQAFNVSTPTRIRHSDYPTGAIYSVDAGGGNPRVEAHGIHNPRGLAFSPLGLPYMTNGGMELRGTRPIKDDPDSLLIVRLGWYGWPDYSTDLQPVTDDRFQLKGDMITLLTKSGYDEIGFLIDHNASNNREGLPPPTLSLLQTTFPSLSGASRFDFVPDKGPLARKYEGNIIVPLSGDHAPFATSGRKLVEPIGFKVVSFDPNKREVQDFIRNSRILPASMLKPGQGLIERPVAAKFAPDGSLYIVDFGKMETKVGRFKIIPNTGRVFRLRPAPSTRPTAVTQAP
jgi:hypothetical protein